MCKGVVTNYRERGGGGGGGGGASEVLPLQKGGQKKFEVVLTRDIEVLAILRGGGRGFNPLEGEA